MNVFEPLFPKQPYGSVTTIVGITGTKAQFDTAVTDGNFAYQSDLASYATTSAVAAGYMPLATSVANRIPKRNGTTGLLQDSGLTVDASDNLTGVGNITASGGLSLSPAIGTGVMQIYNALDPQNLSENSAYITPSGNGTRLYLGVAGKQFYAVNFSNVSQIESFPTVAGNITASGSVGIGGGTAITKVLSATATLDFASVAAGAYEDLTITVTGAVSGNTVSLGVPNGSMLADLAVFGWVSAADTVTIRVINTSTTTARDPASGTWRATVTQF